MKTLRQFLDKKVMSPEELSKKHNVDITHIKKQLEMGTKVEYEHTSNAEAAKRIALAHIGEDPNYYTKLRKIENK